MRQLRKGIGNRGVAHKWCLERLELEMLHNHLQLVGKFVECPSMHDQPAASATLWELGRECVFEMLLKHLQMLDALTDRALA